MRPALGPRLQDSSKALMISKTIHSIWLSSDLKPEQVRSCIERCSLINHDYQVRPWSLGDIFRHFDEIPAFVYEALDPKKWAFATDWARLAILERYGGIYLDSDVMCHKPFDHLLDCAGFISWESKELLGPHCLGAEAENPIIRDWLSIYRDRRFKLSEWVTDQTPMPTLITDFSVDHHGLRRDGRTRVMAGGFRVHTADLLTSNVNSHCIAEHLYHGGWLGHKDSSFADDLRRSNSSFLHKPRSKFDRFLEALGKNPIEASYRKRSITEQKKTLCLVDPVERSVPHVSYWHVGAVSRPNLHLGKLSGKPLVSVIVSTLNGGLQIERCLQSLSRQTYSNNEIVIIDRGSPDGSRRICEEHGSQDPNIKIFETELDGRGRLRNFGLEKISGELVCFIDGEDTVTPDHIASLVNGFSGEIDLTVCDHEEASPDGAVLKACHTGRMHGEKDAAVHLLLTDADCYAWNKMFRRSIFDFEPFRFGSGCFEDFAFMPAVIGSVRALSFTNARTYRHAQRPDPLLAPQGAIDAALQLDIIAAARHLIRLEPVFRP
jgi:hypothetical protein